MKTARIERSRAREESTMVNTGRKAAKQTKLVVPMWGLHEANAKVEALEKENEQLKQELARVTVAGGGEAGTSVGKRTRTEPIDRSIEKALPRLPTEVWAEVAKKLKEEDLLAFALTSKQLREAQQQAGRRLVTRISPWKTERSFSRDWCVWLSKQLNPTATAPEIMFHIIQVASIGGYVDVMKKYWSDIPEKKKSLSMNERTCSSAARQGHLEVLKWLRSEGCPWNGGTCSLAAANGHLEILKWLRSEGCPWDARACTTAAEMGDLEILKWLRSEGCPWTEYACTYAAACGHLEVLKWLRSEGCPWDADACRYAARRGHLEILKWLRSEGCPWDEYEVCWVAAEVGHLSVLKHLMSEGCTWDRDFTDALEEEGRIEALEWLVSLGHYTNEELRSVKERMTI